VVRSVSQTPATRILGRPLAAASPRVGPDVTDATPVTHQTRGGIAATSWGDDRTPPNVEQLTDSVLRTLDSRLVAARERLSRF
jgi:hypothetical protein